MRSNDQGFRTSSHDKYCIDTRANLGYPPPRLSLLLTLIFRSTRGNVLRNAWLPMRLLIELLRPSNFYDGDRVCVDIFSLLIGVRSTPCTARLDAKVQQATCV
jgi:hypothetical protein